MKKEVLNQWKEQYVHMEVPKEVLTRMEQSIAKAKEDKKKMKQKKWMKNIGAGLAASLVIAALLPNISPDIALAMDKVPVLSGFVKVVTFGRYEFQDENHSLKAEIPRLEESGDAEKQINKEVVDYTNLALNEFYADQKSNAISSLDISYQVITDTDTWFTLKINVLETKASGYEMVKYYHIDKQTGTQMALSDLFTSDFDYISIISEDIKKQMIQEMESDKTKMYFLNSEMPETDFQQITSDQNFYFNKNGDLVIAFDEYEVAPGSMGAPEFIIPASLLNL